MKLSLTTVYDQFLEISATFLLSGSMALLRMGCQLESSSDLTPIHHKMCIKQKRIDSRISDHLPD